jgi:MFS transporter, DHA2 family, multidrug resistance protein
MAQGMPPMEFSMPMFREFVPKAVRPWIYVFFAVVFQLSGGVYLGNLTQMVGTTSWMREEVMMVGLCGVVGVCMPFPFLFRYKFRYTNRQLLLYAASIIAVCNILSIYVHSLPLLCLISFVAGYAKLCGTFECMSNIQLWMAPGRDFTLFFPYLYIIIIGDMSLSSWVANNIAYHFGGWQMMHWFMVGLLLVVLLILLTMVRHVRIMPKIPLLSLDWLGCILWSLSLIEAIWIFTFGEHYNWFDSKWFCSICILFALTFTMCLLRMHRVRHPFISPKAFRYKGLLPVLGLFAVCEFMSAGSKSLQKVFMTSVLHYGPLTLSDFSLWEFAGVVVGCLFVIFCIKALKIRYTRLLTFGFVMLLCYHLIMYFRLSPDMSAGMFIFPTMLRTFGYSIFFCILTIYLEEKMTFAHFFMGLNICGFVRNGLAESMASALYSHSLRYYVADYACRYAPSGIAPLDPMMSGIKTLYGWTCLVGCFVLLVFLLYDLEPVRKTFRKIPSWKAVGRRLRIVNLFS